MININASPYYIDRVAERKQMLATRAADASCGLVYLNCVGGQDELVFDGASMVFDAAGGWWRPCRSSEEECGSLDLDVRPVFRKRLLDPRGHRSAPPLPLVEVTPEPRRPRTPRLPPRSPPRSAARGGGLPGAACSACATTSAKTASPTWSSASPEVSTPRWSRGRH